MSRWLTVLLTAAVAVFAQGGQAQDKWPSKPIRIQVSHAAGTILDVWARRIGDRLSQNVGQPVIVENKPGAGGTLGASAFVKQPADGHSLMLAGMAELAVGPAFYGNLPYDPVKDLTPITVVAESSALLVVNPALGVRTFADLVALAKSKPGTLTCGSFGNGTISQMMLLQLNRSAGIEIVHVPYKDAAAAITDVMGGQISMMFNWPTIVKPFVDSGKLTAVLVTGKERLPAFANVQTASDVALPQMVITGWSGFVAPAGVPRSLVDQINRELLRAVDSPEIKPRIEEVGSKVVTGTPEAFAARLKAELDNAHALVKATGAKIE